MSRLTDASNVELIRLDAIVENLGLGRSWVGPQMNNEIVAAAVEAATPILVGTPPRGEIIADRLACHYQVRFKEVRTEADINAIEVEYLRNKKEIGFGQLRLELQDPNVDALLFQRLYASAEASDRWVAVLNLQRTERRAYWNKFHELSHRIAEPEQQLLPFRREGSSTVKNQVEKLVDSIAAELGFHRQAFGPLLLSAQRHRLSFALIGRLRDVFAPTASLQSVTNVVVARWLRPAIVFEASVHGRLGNDQLDRALRVERPISNDLAKRDGLFLFKNMRVPTASVVYRAFESRGSEAGTERGELWKTSTGAYIGHQELFVSAIPFGENRVRGLISLLDCSRKGFRFSLDGEGTMYGR